MATMGNVGTSRTILSMLQKGEFQQVQLPGQPAPEIDSKPEPLQGSLVLRSSNPPLPKTVEHKDLADKFAKLPFFKALKKPTISQYPSDKDVHIIFSQLTRDQKNKANSEFATLGFKGKQAGGWTYNESTGGATYVVDLNFFRTAINNKHQEIEQKANSTRCVIL